MASRHEPARLSVEHLERREVPAAGAWLVEPFDRAASASVLPGNWKQWASDVAAPPVFQVDQVGAGLGGQGRLVADANSVTSGRAWLNTVYSADVEVSAGVYLSGAAQSQLLVRGQNLNSATPSYYAVGVRRGVEVQLLRVVNGTTTVLGTVKSADWLSGAWVTVKLRAEGDQLNAFVFRGDTNQYLSPTGQWVGTPTAALTRTDTAVRPGGNVGFARPTGFAGGIPLDSLKVGPAAAGANDPLREERFDTPAGQVPDGWASWSSDGDSTFTVQDDATLVVSGRSSSLARAWMTMPVPTDSQVSASLYADSLVPGGLFLRGSWVNSNKFTGYEVTVVRGLEVDLWRVVNGTRTLLGSLSTTGWQSGLWVQVSLVAKGDQLRVQLYRSDSGQYLNADGTWGLSPAWAISRTDAAVKTGGLAGFSSGPGSASDLKLDNFLVTTPQADLTRASVIPTEQDKLSAVNPPDSPPPPPVPPVPPPPPPPVSPPPPPVVPPSPPPPVVPPVPPVVVPPVPPASPPPPVTPPPTNSTLPTVPRHFTHIRVAQLAYFGNPMGAIEQKLLRDAIDLVVPNLSYVDDISKVSPNTPSLVYTNVSNIYLGLLTDWLAYADRNKLSREAIFYHVNKALTFYGMSASAVPVNQFWGVFRGNDAAGWTDLTTNARQSSATTFKFGGAGESLAVGYTEKFREINVDVTAAAGAGWKAALEYVSAVDAQGRPTRWSTLTTLGDGTAGLTRDGRLTFNPPKDWVAASVNGSARLFYVRFRTTAGTAATAPSVNTLLGRDYTSYDAKNEKGTIPAFDRNADLDGDGYLNDAEYARRRAGFDARFVYESRLTYPYYGPNRFATNPAAPALAQWSIDYHKRFLAQYPNVDGFFVDNSTGRIAVNAADLVEPLGDYAESYGRTLGQINTALGPKWLLTNSAGGGGSVDPQIKYGVSYLEEFALRPMASNHVQFDDLAAMLRSRRQLSQGRGYEILDTLARGADAADPRMMLSSLAMYYLLADPKQSFLMINGGQEPSTSWSRHWTEAIRYNVGQPTGNTTLFAQGRDPAKTSLQYKVYSRQYQNALVLYKPLSYTTGVNGTTADNTATTHQLNGWYRVVKNDGTLGPLVNSIKLRNGEGVVLAKAAAPTTVTTTTRV